MTPRDRRSQTGESERPGIRPYAPDPTWQPDPENNRNPSAGEELGEENTRGVVVIDSGGNDITQSEIKDVRDSVKTVKDATGGVFVL
jgi:hypothetical protein